MKKLDKPRLTIE